MTILQLKEVLRLCSPDLVVLNKTKNKKAMLEKVKSRIGFETIEVMESRGKVGVMVAYWKSTSKVMKVLTIAFTLEIKIRGPIETLSGGVLECMLTL